MTRRSFSATALATAATTPAALLGQDASEVKKFRLKLKHTWTTVMSSSDYRELIRVRLRRDGIDGYGEGAPIVRYNEDAESAIPLLMPFTQQINAKSMLAYRKLLQTVFDKIKGNYAAKAALDIAVLDWVGKKQNLPLYRLFGLNASDTPMTTFSIGIDDPETTKKKVLEAEQYPILKVKFGLGKDEATMEAIRSVTNKPIRADANEGYKTKEEALQRIQFLEKHGVEFIEQPLPAAMIEETAWLRKRVNIPIFADEACLHAEDISKIAGSFDGVVIKIMKTGGLIEALRMIQVARTFHLKILLGCMIESSLSITAAAHLSPLVDYADLDGNLLVGNDPWSGVKVLNGKLLLPDRPGVGCLATSAVNINRMKV
jgi:L-Ala-D/L-Glu epimerase